jgi:hypothetical protein
VKITVRLKSFDHIPRSELVKSKDPESRKIPSYASALHICGLHSGIGLLTTLIKRERASSRKLHKCRGGGLVTIMTSRYRYLAVNKAEQARCSGKCAKTSVGRFSSY